MRTQTRAARIGLLRDCCQEPPTAYQLPASRTGGSAPRPAPCLLPSVPPPSPDSAYSPRLLYACRRGWSVTRGSASRSHVPSGLRTRPRGRAAASAEQRNEGSRQERRICRVALPLSACDGASGSSCTCSPALARGSSGHGPSACRPRPPALGLDSWYLRAWSANGWDFCVVESMRATAGPGTRC